MSLSVCIVTYNHEDFIEECIESVLAQQTDFDLDIRIGDDASTDGTPEILRCLQEKHPGKLTVIYRPQNIGAEKNFEDIVLGSTKTFVAFLEGDNYWCDPHKIQRQVDLMGKCPELSFCFHRAQIASQAGDLINRYVPPGGFPDISDSHVMLQDDHCPVALGAMVVRRSYLDDMPRWVSGLKLGDWPMCILLADIAKVGFLDQVMSVQREHKGGAWSRLPPIARAIYASQMFLHIKSFASPPISARLNTLLEKNINWISGQIIGDPNLGVTVLDQALDDCGEEKLTRLIAHGLIRQANELREATEWHRSQSLAWEASASDANEALAVLEEAREAAAKEAEGKKFMNRFKRPNS